jgi:Flp pilus assembly protein CpaB
MDIEYTDDRRRSKLLVGFGIVLALVAGVGAYYAVSTARQSSTASASRLQGVVALQAMKAREPIKAEQVQVQDIALDPANVAGVATDVTQVVGRVPAVAILQGQIVTTNMLASSSNAEFSILEPDETVGPDSEYWRAIALTVPDDLAVGGTLEAGQTVDVFVTAVVGVPEDLAETGRYYTDRATKIVYQRALILARDGAFYIMRATLPVAEEIAHLQASGTATFSFALRPDVDTRVADTEDLGQTLNEIIEKYGLPYPENLDGRPASRPAPTPTPEPSPSADASGDPEESDEPASSTDPDASASAGP